MKLNSFEIKYLSAALFLLFLTQFGCTSDQTKPVLGILQISKVRIGTLAIATVGPATENAPINSSILVEFSETLQKDEIQKHILLLDATLTEVALTYSFLDFDKTLSLQPISDLRSNQEYTLHIRSSLKGRKGEIFTGTEIKFKTIPGTLAIASLKIDGQNVSASRVTNISQQPTIEINFDKPVDPNLINSQNIFLATIGGSIPITFSISDGNKKVTITSPNTLRHLTRYRLFISSALKGLQQENFAGTTQFFYTKIDPTPKFPIISDDALLTLVEQQTFKYFYDFAHPASGMARERNSSGDLVTLGGSGFGVMALIVGIERGFITRSQGLDRLNKVITFLETSDRFHGAWPHWINGNTGKTIPFSANDNGADLVETAFMVQGLITVRQYLNGAVSEEQSLKDRINVLCEAVDWNWFTRGNQNVLYWHWSLDKGWAMNMQINGYNEALIVYTLAATSTTYTISPAVYNNGWARNGAMRNNKLFYNIKLPLGYDFGGPLFFAHYSFLGLNPKSLSDQYANYWEQNVNHTLINRAYCIANPKNFVSYSNQNWGLTASDNQSGYSAHSPTNDLGVISPTAALSSMPYTPTESMDALKFFYYTMGDQLWGDYGFYDAFNVTEGWIANSYLAIDQGPIIIMIENHRSALLWNLFMSAPEVKDGLTKLGFSY
jgi:hypothetical protein